MSDTDWLKLILNSNVAAAVVVGIFGLLSLWLGLGRFRSERWWERKASSYASAIEGLHAIEVHASKYVDSIENGYEISEAWAARLDEARANGMEELKKGAGIGSLVMSKTAATILADTLCKLEAVSAFQMNYIDYHQKRADLAKGAIILLEREAKRDLRV